MKLIVEPADGAAPILAALKRARRSIEIAIFRFDHKDVEQALIAAAERGVRVTALIAFVNRGGEKSLRDLESRLLKAGIIVARTNDDLVRYHGKYILIDRCILHVLSFNFTHLDISKSRGFGVVTSRPDCLKEAVKLFKADCTRTKYVPKADALVVSPVNSRHVLSTFVKRAKKQLLIYDPKISDKAFLRILEERAKAGVEIKVIGQTSGRPGFEVRKLAGLRLHTRTIIRDGRKAFVGSQSLRAAELDSRREVGLVVHDAKSVRTLVATFESDWKVTQDKRVAKEADVADDREKASEEAPSEASAKDVAKAVKVFTKELKPLATTVKKAVRQAVVKAGDDILHDKDMKDTMKKVVKQAVKEAVKTAVQEAQVAVAAETSGK